MWLRDVLIDFPGEEVLDPFDDPARDPEDTTLDELPPEARTDLTERQTRWFEHGYIYTGGGDGQQAWVTDTLSPAEAVDYYMLVMKDYTPAQWAALRDRGTESVRKNKRQAQRKLLVLESLEGTSYRPADAPPLTEYHAELPLVDPGAQDSTDTPSTAPKRSRTHGSETDRTAEAIREILEEAVEVANGHRFHPEHGYGIDDIVSSLDCACTVLTVPDHDGLEVTIYPVGDSMQDLSTFVTISERTGGREFGDSRLEGYLVTLASLVEEDRLDRLTEAGLEVESDAGMVYEYE